MDGSARARVMTVERRIGPSAVAALGQGSVNAVRQQCQLAHFELPFIVIGVPFSFHCFCGGDNQDVDRGSMGRLGNHEFGFSYLMHKYRNSTPDRYSILDGRYCWTWVRA